MHNFLDKVKQKFKTIWDNIKRKEFWKEQFSTSWKKIKKGSRSDSGISLFASIFAILSGLMFGFLLILFMFGPGQAFRGIFIIFTGGFSDGFKSFGDALNVAVPIIVTGLSVGFAFKTGLFNIGATGQMTAGAMLAIYVGVHWTWLPGHLHWMVAILAAMFGGAVWGFIPGFLKARFNVHEVVATIMLNYIMMYTAFVFTRSFIFDVDKSQSLSVAETAALPSMFMDKLFPGSELNGGFIIAILAVVVIYIVLQKTTFGFQLKAVGYNKDAAKYAGINEKRSIIYSMMIAGALAGLAGALIYLRLGADHYSIKGYLLLPQGFDGIAVALLGLSHPIGVFASGIFFGYIRTAGFYLQSPTFSTEVIDIIIASIIYLSALSIIFRTFAKKILKVQDVTGGDA